MAIKRSADDPLEELNKLKKKVLMNVTKKIRQAL